MSISSSLFHSPASTCPFTSPPLSLTQFSKNDLHDYCRYGTYFYKNGSIYDGEFIEDEAHGLGTFKVRCQGVGPRASGFLGV
jgi:hypothetical protein